jgi:hypothetical protein
MTIEALLGELIVELRASNRKEERLMAAIDDLTAAVGELTTTVADVDAKITALKGGTPSGGATGATDAQLVPLTAAVNAAVSNLQAAIQ